MQVRLFPTPAQEAALVDTLNLCNRAANEVSRIAWDTKTFRNYDLRRHTYIWCKNMGLSAQPAQHVIKKVTDAYTTVRAQVRANLRKPLDKPIRFRKDSAPRRGRAGPRRPGLHLSGAFSPRAHGQTEPAGPGNLLLYVVRLR